MKAVVRYAVPGHGVYEAVNTLCSDEGEARRWAKWKARHLEDEGFLLIEGADAWCGSTGGSDDGYCPCVLTAGHRPPHLCQHDVQQPPPKQQGNRF